jgi:biopolymer transport protein TolQ
MRLRGILAAVAVTAAILFAAGTAAPAFAQEAPRAAPVGNAQTDTAPLPAPTANVEVSQAGGGAIGPKVHGFSVISLFMDADPIVKTVMALLFLASLWSWAIILNKALAFSLVRRRAKRFEKVFWSGLSLDELYQQFSSRADHPMAAVFTAALREWRRAFDGGPPREALLDSIKDRIDKAMSVTIMRETDALENQLGFLATVGATAPFVGLFGTVWGIMNSFSAIAARHDTTLAVVAPGIAEALFATAMGLLAAIPAVIFYNKFVGDIGRYTGRVEAFADEFSAILSRQLDEKASR